MVIVRKKLYNKKNIGKNAQAAKSYNLYRKKNITPLYNLYKSKAEKDGKEFKLSIEIFTKLVNSQCYYCGRKKLKFFLGVDRMDNYKGYITENCVACCQKCNYMKNTLNHTTFILMCIHITHYNRMLKCSLFPHVFNKYIHKKNYKKLSM